jgi:hypothetical protein
LSPRWLVEEIKPILQFRVPGNWHFHPQVRSSLTRPFMTEISSILKTHHEIIHSIFSHQTIIHSQSSLPCFDNPSNIWEFLTWETKPFASPITKRSSPWFATRQTRQSRYNTFKYWATFTFFPNPPLLQPFSTPLS